MTFQKYRRSQIAELRPFVEGEHLPEAVSVSAEDRRNGSPKAGDMIARNPKNHADQWLVAAAYFADNFEPSCAAAPFGYLRRIDIARGCFSSMRTQIQGFADDEFSVPVFLAAGKTQAEIARATVAEENPE